MRSRSKSNPTFPATIDEHPNWRRRYAGDAAELLDRPDVRNRLAAAERREANDERAARHDAAAIPQRLYLRRCTRLWSPYFASLGISHLYASPIMTARPGSPHGYDVIDPTRVNPELGGEEEFRRLVARRFGGMQMGLIVDIVPNHMAVGNDNAWWMDVLARGRNSRYAKFFDIDWAPVRPHLRDKVLLPILGRPYGEALAAGDITLAARQRARSLSSSAISITYFRLADADRVIEGASPDVFDPHSPTGRERLHQLLERQHYRLAWWRCANDEINWRRFFDINDLAAIRVEDDEVFESGSRARCFGFMRKD